MFLGCPSMGSMWMPGGRPEPRLDSEELAFYDAVTAVGESIYDDKFLCDLIHEVVQNIKRNLKVDWTEPHREDVKAGVRAAVKRVLRSKGVIS